MKPTIAVRPTSKPAPTTLPAESTVSHFAVTCSGAYYACHEGLTLNAANLDTQSAMAFIGEWRPRDSDDRDDLWVDQTGFLARKGGRIAVVAADSAPSKVKCQKVGVWRSEISFAELREDSQLCMRTGVYGRLAGIVLRSKPAGGRVTIAGYTFF